MEKKTLANILEGKIFKIPDYQRGYSWEIKQWEDFVHDIDALIDEEIINHYTGTIVIYQAPNKPTENYGIDRLEIVDIVDGQQRLTTCSLYLSVILRELIKKGEIEYTTKLPIFLYSGTKSKLQLNNDTSDYYMDIISNGNSNIEARSVHQKNLSDAYKFLQSHVFKQLGIREDNGQDYLKNLFDAITRKLNFSFYPIEVESEIGMTFELMNSRGKDLSSLELLKNYLMYWVYRNINESFEKEEFTKIINKTWKELYINISNCNGNENQCLRIAWTLFVNYTPKNWDGYNGFKADDVIPLRDFNQKSKEETKNFLKKFVNGLALISKHYLAILNPENYSNNVMEKQLLIKIMNAGNIANYLPLMVAVRIKLEEDESRFDEYRDLLKALEIFSYRVFLWEGKRSNAGLSKFYSWADDVFTQNYKISSVTEWVYETIAWYSHEETFQRTLKEEFLNGIIKKDC